MIDGLRRDAGAERGREITLGERGIVAVPVQMHAFARPLTEDRRKIARGMALVRRNGVEQHLHLHELVRIEGVDPARAPGCLLRQKCLQP
jgi:hypothetical protein